MQTQFGNDVIIKSESVQAILDTLIYPSRVKKAVNSLQYLMLVDQVLFNPSTPKAPHQRLYILQNILVELIQEHLSLARHIFGNMDDLQDESYAKACQAIIRDSHNSNSEAIAWSTLHYLYVQVNLGFTVQILADNLNVDERTIRRYRQDGLELLTKILWECELKAREAFKFKHIKNQLVGEKTETLFDRQTDIDNLINTVTVHHLSTACIVGSKGIGKTAFLRHGVAILLKLLSIDDLIWISSPVDIVSTIEAIKDRFLRDKDIVLEKIFSLFTCMIVIDDADALLQNASEWNTFLDSMRGAYILFSASNHIPQYKPMGLITLEALNISSIDALAQELYQYDIDSNFLDYLYRFGEGNPLKTRLLISKYNYLKRQGIQSIEEANHLSDFVQNGINNKFLESIILTIPPQGLYKSLIVSYYPEFTVHIDSLVTFNLISIQDDIVYTPDIVREDLKISVDSQIIERIYRLITPRIQKEPQSLIGFVEYHWTALLLPIWTEDQFEWIKVCWKIGLQQGRFALWYGVLLDAKKVKSDLWIDIAISACLRELNRKSDSIKLLESIIADAGSIGNFPILADAMLELSKSYRLLGHYQEARFHLHKIEKSLSLYLDAKQLRMLFLEKAHIDLLQENYDAALSSINSINSIEADLLRAEIFLQQGKYDDCIDICDKLFHVRDLALGIKGVIHNLVGRCYHKQELFYPATEQFSLALDCYRQSLNVLEIARVRINLASSLIYTNDLNQASIELKHAQKMCLIAKDRVGLNAIKHNQLQIDRKRLFGV